MDQGRDPGAVVRGSRVCLRVWELEANLNLTVLVKREAAVDGADRGGFRVSPSTFFA